MKGFIQATISLALAALVRGSPLALNQTLTDNDDMHALEVRGDLDAVDIMFTGMQYCGIYANAEGDRITLLSTALGKGDLKNNAYNIPAGGCNRVQCYDTSGIYVCNDNDYDIALTGQQIYSVSNFLLLGTGCCHFLTTGKSNWWAMSAQQFTQWGWNVNFGYADCKTQSSDTRPSDAGGWGVNFPTDTCAAKSVIESGP